MITPDDCQYKVIEMSILYGKLFEIMQQKGVRKTDLRSNGIHPAVIKKIMDGGTITTETIDRLCALLDCQPGDIIEFERSDDSKESIVN